MEYPVRGFSVVELLVVIAIMCICMSLLLPGLTGARKLANKAKCLSNLRQIGVAEIVYSDDYNGLFTSTYSGPDWLTWDNKLKPYLDINTAGKNVVTYGDRSVFLCPELCTRPGYAATSSWRCYFLNQWIGSDTQAIRWLFKRFAPPHPGRTILVAEGLVRNTDTIKPDDGPRADTSGVSEMEYRHGDGANYLFCDGHVEWIKGSVTDATAPSLWSWRTVP